MAQSMWAQQPSSNDRNAPVPVYKTNDLAEVPDTSWQGMPPQTGGITPFVPSTGGDEIMGGGPIPGVNVTHGNAFDRPGTGGGMEPNPSRGPGGYNGGGINPGGMYTPRWPSFRRQNFWQQIQQMARPSVSTSAAGQARAQQQQSNAARARAAFLSGFNSVRRPAYPMTGGGDPYNSNPHGGPSEFAATNENVRIGYQYGGGPAVGNQPRGYAY